MLEKIKLALRISHKYLDDEISNTIEVARAELIRSGVSADKANSQDDVLIYSAIKTYCMFAFAGDAKISDGYFKSWSYQLENLRKSSGYMAEDNKNV